MQRRWQQRVFFWGRFLIAAATSVGIAATILGYPHITGRSALRGAPGIILLVGVVIAFMKAVDTKCGFGHPPPRSRWIDPEPPRYPWVGGASIGWLLAAAIFIVRFWWA